MIKINTQEEFENFLNIERGILFLNFDWSGYTVMVTPLIYHWADNSTLLKDNFIDAYEFSPDNSQNDYYMNWIRSNKAKIRETGARQLEYHGYGDVVLIRCGEILGGTSIFTELKRNADERNSGKLSDEEKRAAAQEFSSKLMDSKTYEFFLKG